MVGKGKHGGRQFEKILNEAYSDLKIFKALENPY
jgi:hypothetical protein